MGIRAASPTPLELPLSNRTWFSYVLNRPPEGARKRSPIVIGQGESLACCFVDAPASSLVQRWDICACPAASLTFEPQAMAAVRGKVVEGDRIIVPAAFRKSMGLSKGDTLFMELHGDELGIRPARSALRRIQAKLRALAPNEGFVSDELMAERRAETDRE